MADADPTAPDPETVEALAIQITGPSRWPLVPESSYGGGERDVARETAKRLLAHPAMRAWEATVEQRGRAEGWDEGWSSGVGDAYRTRPATRNPYQQEQP